jgi:hypothetical protein
MYSTVGAVFRVAAIIRVAALFGALKIIFSDLYFLHDNLQVVKIQNQNKKFEFFFVAFFELKVKTAVFLKMAAAAAVVDLEQ